jgi:hypothetical protein
MTCPEPPWDELDDGIRPTVRSLWEQGFNPTDSGDGLKKGMECALPYPHVHMVCEPTELITEAQRLLFLAKGWGIKPMEDGAPIVEAVYSPDDGIATLTLYGAVPSHLHVEVIDSQDNPSAITVTDLDDASPIELMKAAHQADSPSAQRKEAIRKKLFGTDDER